MSRLAAAVVLAVAAATAVAASADDRRPTPTPAARPSPSPDVGGASWQRAAPPAITRGRASAPVAASVPRPADVPAAAGAGGWAEAKGVEIKEGAARVLVDGALLQLRPGSTVGADRVIGIGSDRIVLAHGVTAVSPAGVATLVVMFDGQGRSQVRVYWLSDPLATMPREVR